MILNETRDNLSFCPKGQDPSIVMSMPVAVAVFVYNGVYNTKQVTTEKFFELRNELITLFVCEKTSNKLFLDCTKVYV